MKSLKILFLIIFFLLLIPSTKACITLDWQFTLNIGSLQIDDKRLENLCEKETCYITEDFIIIKSSYDERIAILVGKTSSILGFKGITFKLPYKMNEDGLPEISEINPEKYDWRNLVEVDLNFLKELGILEISFETIKEISSLATNGKNIMFCNSSWQALEANCFCDGEIVCMRCSAPAFNVKVPEKLLSIESRNQFLIYLLAFTLISILVFVFLKLKLLHQLF